MLKLFPFRQPKPEAKIRLFCFPYAGSGASIYRLWTQRFNPLIDVCPVEIPGRGARFGEPLAENMSALRDRIAEGMEPLLDMPVAFFGHSLGAKLAFEISKQLGGAGKDKRIVHLFTSAASAPNIKAPNPMSVLSREDLMRELRKFGGTPEEVLADTELMDIYMPMLRSDLSIFDNYMATDTVRAPCNITTFAATADDRVPVDRARGWEAYSGGTFRFLTLDGAGHFYLASAVDMLEREILSDLATQL